jgi:hypothetical protein
VVEGLRYAEAGAAASLVGVRASVVSGGALCVVAVAGTAAALPAFWAYDARRDTGVGTPGKDGALLP